MSRGRRAAAVLGVLVLVFVTVGLLLTPRAHAQQAPAPAQDCPAAKLGLPCDPGWGQVLSPIVDPVKEAASEQFCPERKAPTVRSPSMDVPWADGGGQTQFQKYGYGGLEVTTHDQGCIAQFKAGSATGVQDAIHSVDELINSLQMAAVGPGSTGGLDAVLPRALAALKATFWGEWMPVAMAAAGCLVLLYGMAARSGALVALSLNVILVLGFVPWLLGNSTTVTDLSNDMTTGAATQTATGLLNLHPSSAGDSAEAAYGDAYYTLAWSSHLASQFEGHEKCATEFAPKFVQTKAFSYDEQLRINAGDTALETRLVQEKNARWLSLADEMKAKYPACYAAWSDPSGAWKPVIKHGFTTFFAGSWIGIASFVVLALKYLLLLGLVVLGAIGVLMLVQRKLTAAFTSMLIAGIAGPPLMAMGSGSLLFLFYVVISDPNTAWWQAIVAGGGLGIAAMIALSYLGPALVGGAAIGLGRAFGRKGSKKGKARLSTVLGGAAAGAVAGRGSSRGGSTGPSVPVDAPAATPVGFTAPGIVDAASPPPPPPEHPTDGAAMPAWWNETGGRQVDTSGPQGGRQHEGMAADWAQFSGEPDDTADADPGIVSRSPAADVPDAEEPPMTGQPSPDYQPGVTHPPMPEPSTGDRDLVQSTFAAYGGRRAPAAIGTAAADDGNLFGPRPGGVDG